jgi:hypothetical protein
MEAIRQIREAESQDLLLKLPAEFVRKRLEIIILPVDNAPIEGEQVQHPDLVLGLFAEESDVLDQITESAMQAREHYPLRIS